MRYELRQFEFRHGSEDVGIIERNARLRKWQSEYKDGGDADVVEFENMRIRF